MPFANKCQVNVCVQAWQCSSFGISSFRIIIIRDRRQGFHGHKAHTKLNNRKQIQFSKRNKLKLLITPNQGLNPLLLPLLISSPSLQRQQWEHYKTSLLPLPPPDSGRVGKGSWGKTPLLMSVPAVSKSTQAGRGHMPMPPSSHSQPKCHWISILYTKKGGDTRHGKCPYKKQGGKSLPSPSKTVWHR